MKILYIGFIDINNPSHIGVRKKMFGQINAMINNGMKVDYVIHKDKNLIYHDSDNDKDIVLNSYNNGLQRRMNMLGKKLTDEIHTRNIDIIYIRYPLSDIYFINFIKRLKKMDKLIYIEIPTYPYDSELKRISLIIDKIFRGRINKYVDYIVTSSDKYDSIYKIPCKFIDNCVDMKEVEFFNHSYSLNKKKINLIAVAFLNYWHGYDRIIEGMKNYYSNGDVDIDIKFTIVGGGGDYNKLVKLVSDYKLEEKVEFTGFKNGDELDRIFEKSDIALGSLAIHRKDISSVSSIKLREYCARGIPFIYAGKDPGFTGKEEFLMKINSNDEYIDMNSIIRFYKNLETKIDISNEMRMYCEEHFKWEDYYNL